MFKVNNKDTGVVLVSLLLTWTYFTPCSSVSIVNLEQLNADWEMLIHRNDQSSFTLFHWWGIIINHRWFFHSNTKTILVRIYSSDTFSTNVGLLFLFQRLWYKPEGHFGRSPGFCSNPILRNFYSYGKKCHIDMKFELDQTY